MLNKILKIGLGFLALLLGGGIYLLYRSHTLVYRLWPEHWLNMGQWRSTALNVPDSVVYNLPGALWSLSYILIIDGLDIGTDLEKRLLWTSVIPLVGAVSELLQALGMMPGVFDICDFCCYAIPYIIYAILKIRICNLQTNK